MKEHKKIFEIHDFYLKFEIHEFFTEFEIHEYFMKFEDIDFREIRNSKETCICENWM